MRILLVANTLPPVDVSGVGEQVLQLAAALHQRGHQVQVLGRGGGSGARGPKLLFPLTAVPPARRALARFRPDVVQVHESDGGLVAAWVAATRGRLRRPLLVALLQVSYREEARAVRAQRWEGRILARPTPRERRFRWLKAPLQMALGRLSARLADLVLAPSRRTASEIERDYGVEGVEVVPNVTGGREIGEVRSGEAESEPGYLLFVGRLRIRKGVDFLLEALARPRFAGLTPRLLVAGDGEHGGRLRARCAALGLGDGVRFLGRCEPARVRALLAGASALVVPSIYEGMPLVILEAMEAGKPVVASRVSGIPEVVEDGETGWLVPAGEPEALAEALAAVLADPMEAIRRGAAGRRRLAERFAPAAAAAAWLRHVSPLLEESPG